MDRRIVSQQPNYFHFITENVTGLYSLWRQNPELKLYYSGRYTDVLRPFSSYPIDSPGLAPKGTRMIENGVIEAVQCVLAARIIEYYAPRGGQPCITIVERQRNRKWVDAAELLRLLRAQFTKYECHLVALERLSFADQIERMVRTKLLIAVHGAGLTNAMFMAEGASVIEVFPSAFFWRGYGDLCSRAKLKYADIDASLSPERDLRRLPEKVRDLLGKRPLTREVYCELAAANKDISIGVKTRQVLRDVAYAPVDPAAICRAAAGLLGGE